MVHSSNAFYEISDRGQVVEAMLRASRSAHAAIGLFSPSRLAVVDAEVASSGQVGGQAEALSAISRTFGLHEFSRSIPDGDGPEPDRRVIWLSSERCLIGMRSNSGDPTPFVALVRPPAPTEFPRWQRDVARIALLYECGRAEWSRSTAEAGSGGGAIGEIMSRLAVACALVDAGRNVVYANRAAGAWLRGQKLLRVSDGRLCASGAERQRRLAGAIHAASIEEPRRAQAMLLREEGTDEPATVVTFLPLPGEAQQALVVFGTRAQCSGFADPLLTAFGLTGAERRLACQLLAGRTLEEASGQAGIRLSTARGYLKAIFAKTGVRRQSEFVAVIGGLIPPILPTPAAPALLRAG